MPLIRFQCLDSWALLSALALALEWRSLGRCELQPDSDAAAVLLDEDGTKLFKGSPLCLDRRIVRLVNLAHEVVDFGSAFGLCHTGSPSQNALATNDRSDNS